MILEESLNQLIPDLQVKTTYIENAFKCEAVYKWDAAKQTKDLRKAVFILLTILDMDILEEYQDCQLVLDLQEILKKPYTEWRL